MRLDSNARAHFRRIVALVDAVPDGLWVEVATDRLKFQANTQAEVAKCRAPFPGALWTKEYVSSCSWWMYSATIEGVLVEIYACTEAPPTCTAVEEEYEVEEDVPTAFERQTVRRKRVRWDCSNGKEKPLCPACNAAIYFSDKFCIMCGKAVATSFTLLAEAAADLGLNVDKVGPSASPGPSATRFVSTPRRYSGES